ncbi:MAG: hypothetical protein HN368_23965 [Spirochaetales bacterium]|jgi:hypothetical protein|nr:hypothetical protein [Spirochaetales bacterium]
MILSVAFLDERFEFTYQAIDDDTFIYTEWRADYPRGDASSQKKQLCLACFFISVIQKDSGIASDLRHRFNMMMRAQMVPDSMLRSVSRHQTEEMTEMNTSHNLEHYAEVEKAQKALF